MWRLGKWYHDTKRYGGLNREDSLTKHTRKSMEILEYTRRPQITLVVSRFWFWVPFLPKFSKIRTDLNVWVKNSDFWDYVPKNRTSSLGNRKSHVKLPQVLKTSSICTNIVVSSRRLFRVTTLPWVPSFPSISSLSQNPFFRGGKKSSQSVTTSGTR